MNNEKFIITKSEAVANKLINHGFTLLSNVCGTYTFINITPEKFNFDSIDTTKVHFTNKLTI